MASDASSKQQEPQQQKEQSPQRLAPHMASHGRGGAGNMADARQSPKLKPEDLETPVLKKPVVTTGRGGTGNMAKNDDPLETRRRQDVQGPVRRFSSGAQYTGRGGAGNVFRDSEEGADLARKTSREQAVVTDEAPPAGRVGSPTSPNPESLATRGMNWLFGKKA